EFGMYVSLDNGSHWLPFQFNLPATPITDINVHQKDLVLSTQGRSFWIMDDLTPLHQWSDAVAASNAHLFKPRDAYRMHYRANPVSISARGNSASAPQYPQPGAVIDYYFAKEPEGAVKLDILDAGGKVVRSFTTAAANERTRESQGSEDQDEDAPRRRGGPVNITRHQGLNRFTWDLGYPGPRQSASRPAGG